MTGISDSIDLAAEPETVPPVRRRLGTGLILWLQVLVCAAVVVAMNLFGDLRDRYIYELYYASLNSCSALGCLLISDDVRSPVFLSLLIAGHRIGMPLDVVFASISLASLMFFAAGLKAESGGEVNGRFFLISLALGSWLYLIQVKLFLAIALYMYARSLGSRSARVAVSILAVLTHESVIVFMMLFWLWRPASLRVRPATIAIVAVLGASLLWYFGDTANVLWSTIERVRMYNDLSERGEVPTMSRTGLFSALFLIFGLIGLLRLRMSSSHLMPVDRIKSVLWMFLPWMILMILASNELFAIRLAELALLNAMIVVPAGRHALAPSRVALLIFSMVLGGLVFIRDVLFA